MNPDKESLLSHNTYNDWRSHPISAFERKLMSNVEMKNFKKPIKSFYQQQNDLISEFIEVSKYEEEIIHSDAEIDKVTIIPLDHCHRAKQTNVIKRTNIDEILAKVVFSLNFLLFLAKGAAAGMTGSLSIISSLLDSAMDLVSGVLMWFMAAGMRQFNPYLYPQGRQRLEPVAIIVLSVIMSVVSFQLIRESITSIIYMATTGQKAPFINNVSIGIIGATILLKIVLWIVCKRYGTSESSAALAQDSRNDVFSNIVTILCSSLSSRLANWDNLKYLDPCGAIIIALYIFFSWINTGYGNVKNLIGHTASTSFLQKITFIAVNHHPDIKFIDTVRAFHFGINFLVEVDIVLDENMPLSKAHDVGESLQKRIEILDEVERCFVHLDYEYLHDPKHEHKLV